ncbi:MAG TPA: DEAD/DEAH box helicase family protein [Gemmatales bacterium]|nr:DEAD/DEAH box helicase family protein [Gemmatales bacterium]
MARKRGKVEAAPLFEARLTTAPCVPKVRAKVEQWARDGYPDVSETTRRLLGHWFKGWHRLPGGRKFMYHYSQQRAVETLIYLFEVAKVRRQKELIEKYADRQDLRLLQFDDFARYCIKMATGSGKTKVMSLAIAWMYFNAVAEPGSDFPKTFLILAPNVIVFERLRTDFEGGRIFVQDPIIPEELRIYWDLQCYMRGEGERASSEGALYLTNIQQFYERAEPKNDEPDPMTAMLGPKPPANTQTVEEFLPRLIRRGGPACVVNDEAHHTHDEESAWNESIRKLHQETPGGLAAQLDFSATPRHQKGQLFSWTIYDYPLRQAILDNIVKRPLKGIAIGIAEQKSEVASTQYQAYLTAGVERWKEYRDKLAKLEKKPILFVMMNDTAKADDVGDWLQRKYPTEFGGDRLLIIHTDKSGEVSKKDLDKARQVARDVDHDKSPVNCIVSVVMLREGWDVQNVTVIVGLRPYTAKANILPEQTVGRGLRLMFRDRGVEERVDIIGNKRFIEFVEQLERDEDLQLDTFELGKDRVSLITIQVDEAKLAQDIAVPELSPILERKKSLAAEIAGLNVRELAGTPLPMKSTDREALDFTYEGYDLISLRKIIDKTYTIPAPQTAEEVIGYYAKRIARELKLPSQFADLVPKVREFLALYAFGKEADLSRPEMVQAISSNVAAYVTVRTFVTALRARIVEEREPTLLNVGRKLSETPAYPWTRPTVKAKKCVFNYVACDNAFEKEFAKFLEEAKDVKRFAKLPERFGFAIEYTDTVGNLRYYEPDFVAVAADGTHWLIETKGQEDVNVAFKDQAAALWCENAGQLTDRPWRYVKVQQTAFEQLQPEEFADLAALALS